MVKKNNFYEINEPEGIQEFIGTNLILIKKEVKNV
jgi:hypothetical protein